MSELRASTAIAWLAVGITAMLAAVAALVASEGVGHLEQLGHWRWVIAGAGYGTVGVGSFLTLRRGARWSLRARVFSLALQCVSLEQAKQVPSQAWLTHSLFVVQVTPFGC